MAVDDTWHKDVKRPDGSVEKVRSSKYGRGKRYAVRYRDDAGKQRSRSFDRKGDAGRFDAGIRTDLARGVYVDPAAGKVTVRRVGADWLSAQTFDPSTREAVERRLRLHVYAHIGDRELRRLTPSVVQAWVRGLQAGGLAPNSVRVVFANLSAVLTAAVDDGKIVKNPCSAPSVKPPAAEQHRVTAWPNEDVASVRAALPKRCRAMVDAAGGCGLRQGELFGLAVEDVDWLRGVVHVRRQVKIVGSRLVFAPPKGGKERDVPLAESVSLRMAAHLAAFPAAAVSLPWREPPGTPRTARLIFTNAERTAYNRNSFNDYTWKPALRAAGVAATRENGMHALRHWFASVQLDGGTSIKALADYLGHADPGFTLRVYTHMMPASEDRSRKAIDRALRGLPGASDASGGAPDVRRADA